MKTIDKLALGVVALLVAGIIGIAIWYFTYSRFSYEQYMGHTYIIYNEKGIVHDPSCGKCNQTLFPED